VKTKTRIRDRLGLVNFSSDIISCKIDQLTVTKLFKITDVFETIARTKTIIKK